MKGLVVLELNELSPVVFDRAVESGKCPNLERLRDTHFRVYTDAREDIEHLEPWILWVTMRTGLSRHEHNIFNLSDGQHARFDQIWDWLEDAGIPCGIVGPINSHKGRLSKGFYLPDPWSASGDVYPDDLRRIYRFLQDRIRSHDTSLEEGESKVGFLLDSLRERVRTRTILGMGSRYMRSRLDRRNRWRLVMDYDRYLVDLGLTLRRRFKTGYTSIYLTSCAHFQHRYWTRHDREYWAGKAPELFNQTNPLEASDLGPGDDPIAEGMRNYDRIVGTILDTCPDADLVMLSGLAQVPFRGDHNGRGFYLYRPYDHDAFMQQIGVRYKRIVRLISRDLMMYFDHEGEREEAIARLREITVAGEPVFAWTKETEGRLFIKIEYTLAADGSTMITVPGRSPLTFNDWLQLITFKTGDHENTGFVDVPLKYKNVVELDSQGKIDLQNVPSTLVNLTRAATGVEVHAPAPRVMRTAS
jgi:hypothetical protein